MSFTIRVRRSRARTPSTPTSGSRWGLRATPTSGCGKLLPYRVTAELMTLAQPHAVFMHCLPAHRGEEVAADVIDGPHSIVWPQAANRLPTEQALLYALVTGDWLGDRRER